MKNLHKKIGAMVLAGMVVFGGVAAGGVNSFAASNKVMVSNKIQERKVRNVENIIRGYGQLLGVSPNEEGLDKINIGKDKKNRKIMRVNGPCEIPLILINANKGPRKVIKVRCQDMYYLIKAI
jgi:hypothetical protein